jgi:23S rRNA pseudouridine2605 synthase
MENENKGIRINKAMAGVGLCSRRGADELILRGAVRVNGQTVGGPGLLLRPGDELEVEGRKIEFAAPAGQERTYLLLNKPVQTVCTARDPEGRPTVLDLLPAKYAHKRLYPVGRLDYFSEGLLLLTDDGELTQRLTHPRHHLPKRYEVLVRAEGGVPASALEEMRRGMTLAEGEKLAPLEAEILEQGSRPDLRPGRDRALLGLTLYQGINRQIRRMCRDLGLVILRLCRVGQGPLRLGDLGAGNCRELAAKEVRLLRAAAGLEE